MRKIALSSLFLLVIYISQAQSNFTFGFRGGVLTSDAIGNVIDYGGEPSIFNPFIGEPIVLRDDKDRSTSSIYYGIVLIHSFNSCIDVSIELNSYDLGTEYHSVRMAGNSTQTTDQELSIEAFNFPIYGTYYLNKFAKIGFSGGVYMNSIRNILYYSHQEQTAPNGGEPSTNTTIYDLKDKINSKTFGALLKVDVSKKILNKLFVGIEGFYNQDLTYLDKKENREDPNVEYARFNAYGIGLQLKYSI